MENRSEKSLAASAGKVSGATAFSRVLGLVREQVVAYLFGAGMATDAFVAAFEFPTCFVTCLPKARCRRLLCRFLRKK